MRKSLLRATRPGSFATSRPSGSRGPSELRPGGVSATLRVVAGRCCRSTVMPAVLILLAFLAACGDEDKKHSAAPAAAGVADRVRDATEQAIRAGASPQARFRGEQVYQQAMPQRMAICGQVTPFAADPEVFVPFVSIVTLLLGQDKAASQYQFEHHIGSTTTEASRVYAAIVAYCYDHGGPSPGPYRSVMAPPPLPDSIPDPASPHRSPAQTANQSATTSTAPAKPAPAVGLAARPLVPMPSSLSPTAEAPPAVGAAPPGEQPGEEGTVTMRQNGNLRADPQGPTVRVLPQGTTLRVFGQAPGGWYQVGDAAPWGWVHASLLDRH